MQWYHIGLIALAIGAAYAAWNVPRAKLWLILGALSFVASALWHNYGLPYPTPFGAATNLAICYAFWILAERRWEMRVWNCFHMMLIIDLLYISGAINDHYAFAVSLEIVNVVAILMIATTGIMERTGGMGMGFGLGRPGWINFVHRRLWPQRSVPRPWWQRRTAAS